MEQKENLELTLDERPESDIIEEFEVPKPVDYQMFVAYTVTDVSGKTEFKNLTVDVKQYFKILAKDEEDFNICLTRTIYAHVFREKQARNEPVEGMTIAIMFITPNTVLL